VAAGASGAPSASTAGARGGANPRGARRGEALAYRRGYQRGLVGGGLPDNYMSTLPASERASYERAYGEAQASRRRPSSPPDTAGSPAGAPASASRPSSPASARSAPSVAWVPKDAAGFVLGLIGYALFINWVQGGLPQAKGWIAAKFINKPYGGSSTGGGVAAQVVPNPAPANVSSQQGTGAVAPQPFGPNGPQLAEPGVGAATQAQANAGIAPGPLT
jgi:hypothetical protein